VDDASGGSFQTFGHKVWQIYRPSYGSFFKLFPLGPSVKSDKGYLVLDIRSHMNLSVYVYASIHLPAALESICAHRLRETFGFRKKLVRTLNDVRKVGRSLN